MDPTARIAQAYGQAPVEEVGHGGHVRPASGWRMFNDAGVEIEVGEFLYGLVRLAKPLRVLETGTHRGIAASYLGLALLENGEGELTTVEYNPQLAAQAGQLLARLGLGEIATVLVCNTFEYEPQGPIDLLLLDTEPAIRFAEFDRYWGHVRPGGFIAIHDLHPELNLTWIKLHGVEHWPYGDFRKYLLGEAILSHELQVVPFTTPRGFTLFQRAATESFSHYRLLTGTLEEHPFEERFDR